VTIEEAIAQLEVDIKRLKVHYDMFFSGAMPRQPYELRKQVDQLIREFNNAAIRKYHHRFMLNTLVGRYNTLCELWGKQLRATEEGGRAAAFSAILEKSPPPARRRQASADEVFYSVSVTDPAAEPEAMRRLYDRYLEARHSDQGRPLIKLESFVKQIAKQAEALRESSGCSSIEFRILRRGDSVSLKARAGK
jgi:hypothetical protein